MSYTRQCSAKVSITTEHWYHVTYQQCGMDRRQTGTNADAHPTTEYHAQDR